MAWALRFQKRVARAAHLRPHKGVRWNIETHTQLSARLRQQASAFRCLETSGGSSVALDVQGSRGRIDAHQVAVQLVADATHRQNVQHALAAL